MKNNVCSSSSDVRKQQPFASTDSSKKSSISDPEKASTSASHIGRVIFVKP